MPGLRCRVLIGRRCIDVHPRRSFRFGSWSFSNSGPGVKLSVNILAGSRVLSAVGTCALRMMA